MCIIFFLNKKDRKNRKQKKKKYKITSDMITKEKNNEVIVQFLDEHNISTIYQKRKIMCGEQNIFILERKKKESDLLWGG